MVAVGTGKRKRNCGQENAFKNVRMTKENFGELRYYYRSLIKVKDGKRGISLSEFIMSLVNDHKQSKLKTFTKSEKEKEEDRRLEERAKEIKDKEQAIKTGMLSIKTAHDNPLTHNTIKPRPTTLVLEQYVLGMRESEYYSDDYRIKTSAEATKITSEIISKIGLSKAMLVARHYASHRSSAYIESNHSLSLLKRDCIALSIFFSRFLK